ncbi:MAG: radical SAM protein [Candidatus Gracilibacteria bacterium]|nr:radical SAM protein [Candidatus Gracilibacteria bacterium]
MKTRAYLQLTKACNLKCKMCDFWKFGRENLDIEHFKKIIDILSLDGNIRGIIFWGGEPFLNQYIYDLIKYSKSKGFNVEIITNGTIINKEKINEIIEDLDEIMFSIDSGISYVHELIRGRNGVYNTIISNLEYMVSLRNTINLNLQINIDVTLQKDNFNNFESIFELVKKYNLKINFDPVQILGYGNSIEGKDLLLTEEQAFNFGEKFLKLKQENPISFIQSVDSVKRIIRYFKGYKIENYCKSLNSDILIDPFGNVLRCWGDSKQLYNLLEKGFIDNTRLSMDKRCYSCGFTHVREDDYNMGYSITNDRFSIYDNI